MVLISNCHCQKLQVLTEIFHIILSIARQSLLDWEKKYEVYEYLSKIDNWEDFSAYDDEADLSIRGVDFIKDGELIAFIVSHYRDYCSHFGWI